MERDLIQLANLPIKYHGIYFKNIDDRWKQTLSECMI